MKQEEKKSAVKKPESTLSTALENPDDRARQAARIHGKEKLRQFRQGIDLAQAVSGVGEASVQFVKCRVEEADDNYRAGMQESKKYAMPFMDVVAIVGAKELSKGIRAELNQITITSGQVYDFIREGSLSLVDLSDQALLKECLEDMKELTSFQKKQICKFRETAYDAMVVKDAIERQRTVLDGLEKPLKEHLQSKEFFDLKQQETNELLKVYFKTSQNDVLKNVNSSSMSAKNLQKLLHTREKNGFSDTDAAAIRLARRQMKYRESRIHAGRLLNIRKRVERLRSYSYCVDGTAGSGLVQIADTVQTVHAAYAVGKFGLKAGVVTASFMGRYSGAAYLLRKVNQCQREKGELLKKKAEAAVKASKPCQAALEQTNVLKEKAKSAKERVNTKLDQNTGVQKYKQMQESAKVTAKETARKVNQAKAAARSAGRKAGQGKDIVLSPVRLLGKGVNDVRRFFTGMRMAFMAVAGIAVAVFLVFIVLLNQILSVFQMESEVALSVILMEDERFIPDMAEVLQGKAEARYQEAETIAGGTPKNPVVLEGHTISQYGHPDENGNWVEGSRIVYLDGNDRVILNGMNNIKDCLAMAYVMMGGDFDSDKRAQTDLIIDLWEMMNPEVTYKESDIYICSNGCSGHLDAVCYGHRDVEVYLTVISMEEIFESGRLPVPVGKSYEVYVDAFMGWTEDNQEWAGLLVNGDWFELYGIDPAGGTGNLAGHGMTQEEMAAIISAYGDLDATRTAICSDAMSFVGQIPYYWGGKAVAKEYRENGFYATVTPDYKGRNKRGLDCSGFVQWIIWRVTDVKLGESTSTITTGMQPVSASELQPGDFGLMAVPGTASNHVGIFVGYDESGQALWCHENSSAGNVSVNNTTCFRYYYRIF